MTTQQRNDKRLQMFHDGVKLIALYQSTLEQMDTMKGTPLYRQRIKNLMRTLEREIESAIDGPLASLDATDSELMSTIQYKMEMILDLSLEELAGLKMAVDEHRDVVHADVQSKGKN